MTSASPATITASQPSSPRHAGVSELPPRRTQRVQSAKGVAPPSLSSQQSPHTGARHRAQGPTAVLPQITQRADEPSPVGISEGTAGS